MNEIIITSIICISVIIIVGVFCYTGYKNNENTKSNKFFKTVNITQKQYEKMLDEINNLKFLIVSIKTCVEFIDIQISNKNNKD